jgi:hypothetical protein
MDPSRWSLLEDYVRGVISTFAHDERIVIWDLYNEPGNNGRHERSWPLLQNAMTWAREANPAQPIAVGVWYENRSLNDFPLSMSDIITFHNHHPEDDLMKQIKLLQEYGRPVICTEYLARTRGSLFEKCLAVFRAKKVGCLDWGLVSGKTQTIYWASSFVILMAWPSPFTSESKRCSITPPKFWNM